MDDETKFFLYALALGFFLAAALSIATYPDEPAPITILDESVPVHIEPTPGPTPTSYIVVEGDTDMILPGEVTPPRIRYNIKAERLF